MNYKIAGRNTGAGCFDDGKIYCFSQGGNNKFEEIVPLRTERSKTGNHWEHIFQCELYDLVVLWGYDRRGAPYWQVSYADGRKYEGLDALELAIRASGDKNIGVV